MSDLLSEGHAWLVEQSFAQLARTITYRRAAQTAVIPAIVGRLATTIDNTGETTAAHTGRRFWIRRADLDLGAGPTFPDRGDELELPTPNGTAVYILHEAPPAQQNDDYLIEIVANYDRTL